MRRVLVVVGLLLAFVVSAGVPLVYGRKLNERLIVVEGMLKKTVEIELRMGELNERMSAAEKSLAGLDEKCAKQATDSRADARQREAASTERQGNLEAKHDALEKKVYNMGLDVTGNSIDEKLRSGRVVGDVQQLRKEVDSITARLQKLADLLLKHVEGHVEREKK